MLLYKICAVIIFMSGIVLAYYDLVCPDGSQRQLRSHGLCMRKNNTNSVYSCLENIFTDTFNESCSEVEDFVRPGNRFVIRGRATIGECSTGRYQPIKFYKTSGPDCIFLKSTCTEVGQVVARNGSGFIDTTCICDYTEGYAYVTRPHDVCNCVPSEEDCSCYVKLCPENKFLSADYECIHTCSNVTNVTKCGTIDKSGKKFTTTTTTIVRTDSTGPFVSNIYIKRKNMRFHIIKQPEYFTKALDTQACIEGEDVHFEYEVLDDNQTALWFKDGTVVSASDKYKVESHGRLHRLIVNSTQFDDEGEYSVGIKNCTRLCKLIVQELPAAVRQLSEEDKGLYLEIIKSGTETRHYIRVVIIGENGVGKTCLLRRLLGESIEDVTSTDEIDVVHRCKIRLHDGQWIFDKDTNKRKDILTRINTSLNAKTSENQQNQPVISKENRQADMTKRSGEGEIEGTKFLAPSTDEQDKMEAINPSTHSLDDENQGNSDALNNEMKSFSESNQLKNEEKIATGLVETLTKVILNELSQFIKDMETNNKEVFVDLEFWDFAGKKEYYPTHPIFLNPNAVHLLVADITKDIIKINTESGYDLIGEFIDFWFDSIHSCSSDTEDSTGDHLSPPVIVVCTGIDKCKDKLDEEKIKFRQQLTTLLGKEDKRKHLRRIFYISNTEPSDEDFDYLRQYIFECGKMIETCGERLPLNWIRLEHALDIVCGAGVNILSWPDMVNLAAKCSIQNEKEVDLFLKYHHKIGNIIYFESLKDHIILSQKWLADAYRCFISDTYDDELKLTDGCPCRNTTG